MFELQGFHDDLIFDGFPVACLGLRNTGGRSGFVTKTRLNPQCMAYIYLHLVGSYGKCIGLYAIH